MQINLYEKEPSVGETAYRLIDALLNGPARYTGRHHFGPFTALGFVLGALFAELTALYALAWIAVTIVQNTVPIFGAVLRRCGVGKTAGQRTFLELTIPAEAAKSAYATEQLHILLRGMVGYDSAWDQLAARKRPYSLELVGNQDQGIRYILVIPTTKADSIRRTLLSYLPGMRVTAVADYLDTALAPTAHIVEFQLSADFVLPLQHHTALAEHDLMTYLTNHMAKLQAHELAALQIVAVPVLSNTHPQVLRHARRLRHAIAAHETLSTQLTAQRTPAGYLLWLLWYPPLHCIRLAGKLVIAVVQLAGTAFSGSHALPDFMQGRQPSPQKTDPYERELAGSIKAKLDEPLFEITLRLLVASPNAGVTRDRMTALITALRPFATPYQSFQVRSSIPLLAPADQYWHQFQERSLSSHHVSQQTILSSSELSDLYHFPDTIRTRTPGLRKSRSQDLAAPLSLTRSNSVIDVIVGANEHGIERLSIGLTREQRQKHTYIIGKTGMGKTTLLKSAIYQDIQNGNGLAVLDPHGDMFRELLDIIPAHRRQDVVVFDPSDRLFPPGLNMLAPGITFASKEEADEWITGTVLSVFAKLTDKTFWGPRMEHILRNTTLSALQQPSPTLFTVQKLLMDKSYQRIVSARLTDPVLAQFWTKEMLPLKTAQLAATVAPLTHRLGHFTTTALSRHILLQTESTVRISDIMNEGKILLANLSKGDIGEDQSTFFGTLLTSLLWTAAYQRSRIPEAERRDFFLYVDEFQTFATPEFSSIISEGRKFHLSLTLSHQNIAQLDDVRLAKIVAGNAATIICLKASPEDEAFILPYMQPVVEPGNIVHLAPHHFYIKTTAPESEDAFSGVTVPLRVTPDSATGDAVRTYSRTHYARPRADVAHQITALLGGKTPAIPNTKQKHGV